MSQINTLHCNTMWYLWNMRTMMNTCCCVCACYCRIVCLALNTALTVDTCWKWCAKVNTGCVCELWPFRVMNQCSNTDCAQTQSSACGFLREGVRFQGWWCWCRSQYRTLPLLISTVRQGHFIWKQSCAAAPQLLQHHPSGLNTKQKQLPDEEEIQTQTQGVSETHYTALS